MGALSILEQFVNNRSISALMMCIKILVYKDKYSEKVKTVPVVRI